MPKDSLDLARALEAILNPKTPGVVEDDQWGPLVPITDAQAEVFEDFSKKYAEMRARHTAEDEKMLADYERRMQMTVPDGSMNGVDFQLIALDGRRYVRWEVK